MSYSDEWFQSLKLIRDRRWPKVEPMPEPKPVEPVASTTWKPWAEMTAEERRKALENRQEKKDATPRPMGR